MDSGAGLTVTDDDRLYIPSTIKNFPGKVRWGDGSTRAIKYTGKATGIGEMVHTGCAADANLMSLGTTLDTVTTSAKRDFLMAFDTKASYLVRDARIIENADGSFVMQRDSEGSWID